MKSEQIDKSDLYKPSSLWQSHIDKDFDFLIDSYKSNDEEKFLYFLQNFGNWNKYLGVETQDIIKKYNSNILLKNYLSEEIFGGYLELWKYFNKDVDLRELDMPRFGNQIGGLIENNFVVMGSFFNQIYATNLLNYLDNEKNKSFVSEFTLGKTKINIPKVNTFYIRYREKAVDSNIIVSAMKDLNISKENTIFSFITNDTDFLPLFKEIKRHHELYWMRGYAKPSNELLDLVQETNQIELSEFFEKYHFFRMANSFWNNQFFEVVDDNFDFYQMQDNYYHKLLDEDWERQRDLDNEFWDMSLDEIDNTIKPKNDNDK